VTGKKHGKDREPEADEGLVEIKGGEEEVAAGEPVSEIDVVRDELEEAKDKYLRALADFDNYRKRVAREKEHYIQCANEDLIRSLLEVVDNLERALEASGQNAGHEALARGVELTLQRLKDILSDAGLCHIECMNLPFDPNFHEAVMAVEKDGVEDETVIEETQKGYTLRGKVIRPSKVVVSKESGGQDG
jgi:molecular chaperone GrpE